MIKYPLKFNSKKAQNTCQKKNEYTTIRDQIMTEQTVEEDDAENFLRHLSEVDSHHNINYKTYSFKDEEVSPWIESGKENQFWKAPDFKTLQPEGGGKKLFSVVRPKTKSRALQAKKHENMCCSTFTTYNPHIPSHSSLNKSKEKQTI